MIENLQGYDIWVTEIRKPSNDRVNDLVFGSRS